MSYKVVPFVAQISKKESTALVAEQLERLINDFAAQGWEYIRLENVETQVAGSTGCFGIGATPGFNTIYKMVVFKK